MVIKKLMMTTHYRSATLKNSAGINKQLLMDLQIYVIV